LSPGLCLEIFTRKSQWALTLFTRWLRRKSNLIELLIRLLIVCLKDGLERKRFKVGSTI